MDKYIKKAISCKFFSSNRIFLGDKMDLVTCLHTNDMPDNNSYHYSHPFLAIALCCPFYKLVPDRQDKTLKKLFAILVF